MRRLLPLAPLLLAAGPTTLQPGRWLIDSAPATATLNGQVLRDLPYTAPTEPQYACLRPAQAADPAGWLTRDTAHDCTLTRRTVAGGRVDIAGTCPPLVKGARPGAIRFTGSWTPTTYRLRFETSNQGENGTMGFTGILTGRRVGACD